MNNKVKIFVDFDNTLVDTTAAACVVYNLLNPGKAPVFPEDIENYDLSPPIILNCDERNKLFSHPLLYDHLGIFPGALECLKELSHYFDIYLVTNCSLENTGYKANWIKEKFPNNDIFKGKIFLNTNNNGFDKSIINMENGILIDDYRENHLTSNAKYHFNFKRYEKQKWGPQQPNDNSIEFTKWDKENIVNTILNLFI